VVAQLASRIPILAKTTLLVLRFIMNPPLNTQTVN
jgi:hypothetical protein